MNALKIKNNNGNVGRLTDILPKGKRVQKGSLGGGTGELTYLPDELPTRDHLDWNGE